MKKVVLALAVLFSVALVSCSSKEAAKADTDTVKEEAVETVVDSVVDTVAVDTVVADSAE